MVVLEPVEACIGEVAEIRQGTGVHRRGSRLSRYLSNSWPPWGISIISVEGFPSVQGSLSPVSLTFVRRGSDCALKKTMGTPEAWDELSQVFARANVSSNELYREEEGLEALGRMSSDRKLLEFGTDNDSLIFFSHGYDTYPSCNCVLLSAEATLELLEAFRERSSRRAGQKERTARQIFGRRGIFSPCSCMHSLSRRSTKATA